MGTTTEANTRINQASDAIRTLKERLSTRQTEHERLRQETAQLRREASAVELENQRLRSQLEQSDPGGIVGSLSVGSDREEEATRLRREVEMLTEQKEALVLILEDLYGVVRKDDGKKSSVGTSGTGIGGALEHSASIGDASMGIESAKPEQETWTNMLPRPSELFACGPLSNE